MNLLWRRVAIGCLLLLGVSVPALAYWYGLNVTDAGLYWAWVGLGLGLACLAITHLNGRNWGNLVLLLALAGCLSASTALGPVPSMVLFTTPFAVLSALAMFGVIVTRDRSKPPSLMDFYSTAVKARRVRPDSQQLEVVEQLDQLAEAYLRYERRRHLPWASLLHTPQGVYLHGPAGRGKSFLLDGMFDVSSSAVKTRFHYHELMSGLSEHINGPARRSVRAAAGRLAPRASLIVIDEVNVLDVASVVLFSQLIEAWWRRGCVVCMSSNQAPEKLFAFVNQEAHTPSGNGGERFLERLGAELTVLPLTQGEDYRLQKLAAADLYQTPVTAETDANLQRIVELLAESELSRAPLRVGEREVNVNLHAGGIAWFEFATLCGAPHSFEDYLQLVARYPTVIVANVPEIRDADEARRFAWLVEIVYDAKHRLIVSAAVPRDSLFAPDVMPTGQEVDFVKITSRLAEMASSEYNYSLAQE